MTTTGGVNGPGFLRPLTWMLTGLALCAGLWFAISKAWVCDDAFISFRYAKNLVEGLGLVYNAGEQVEGYTNFLWVMLIAAGMALGADPIVLGQVLGIGFFAGTVLVLWSTAGRMRAIPLAAIGLALHEHSLLFSSCGLETSMFTFLVTAGLVQLTVAERGMQFGRAGLFLILATMTRPDGAIFYAVASLVVLSAAVKNQDWRPLAGYAAAFLLLYLPYFRWKLLYYHFPFPNTFYAKSASEPYIEQGFYYVRLFFQCYYCLIPALLVPLVLSLWPRRHAEGNEEKPGLAGRRGPVLVVLFTLPYLAYVVWVGGDFMFTRFCLPVTPALFLGLQFLLRGQIQKWIPTLCACTAVILCSFYTAYPKEAIKPSNERKIGEERDYYPDWYVECYQIIGAKLRERFAGADLRVAIGGGQAMLAYFGDFPYVVELHGLTDSYIAHRSIEQRGHIGHEKQLPLDHPYLSRRGVGMIIGAYEQRVVPNDRLAELRKFEFEVVDAPFKGKKQTGFAQATLLTYDAEVLEKVAGHKDIRFTDFSKHLDQYIQKMDQMETEEVRLDLKAFDAFYFEHNDDAGRRAQIQAHLDSK